MNSTEGKRRVALEMFEMISKDMKRDFNEWRISQLEAALCGLLNMRKADSPPSVSLLEGRPIVPMRGGDPAQIASLAKMFRLVPNRSCGMSPGN